MTGTRSERVARAKRVRCMRAVRRRFVALALLKHDRITTADCAAPHYGSIHTNVDLVMLGRRAQDSRIPREIPLRESGHHTTPARTGDVQAHRRPDGERVADPGIFRKKWVRECWQSPRRSMAPAP